MAEKPIVYVGIDIGTWSSKVAWIAEGDIDYDNVNIMQFGCNNNIATSLLVNEINDCEYGSTKQLCCNIRFISRLFGRNYSEMKQQFQLYEQKCEKSRNDGIVLLVKSKTDNIIKITPFEVLLKYYKFLLDEIKLRFHNAQIILALASPSGSTFEQTRQMSKLCMYYIQHLYSIA